MLRASAVAEVGKIPATIQVVPDYYLYVALARNYKARAVQQVVYRVHPGSMSASHEYRRRLHEEPPLIIRQWASQVDPRIVRSRLKRFNKAKATPALLAGDRIRVRPRL